MKRFRTILAAGLFAATASLQAIAADYTLNVNTALTPEDPLFKGLEAFRDTVAARTDGKVEIRIFPSSQLGKDEDVLEQARAGAPVAVVVDGGRLAVFQKEFGALGAPFLASGYDGIRKVVTSDLFADWVKQLHDTAGLQVLSFNWWQGERHLLTKKPVASPADLAGVRMRTPGAPVWMETIRAMGATPTPMGWTEVYSALQQGVIDAAEAQHPATLGAKLDEVITHITKTGHINLITGLVAGAAWYDSLPEDLRQIVSEEALKAGDIASYGTQDALSSIEAKLTENGVTIAEIDTTVFREATAPVYDMLGYGDLRDTLRGIAAQ
ncbi:C4-dicarboxylate TRAP transporter substrate-binding protein [Polymorphum gilvum]|uniref:TRAP dicarboxylate transporter, DctP subunit n=1 Tax=Polymorphum gilvum (strain LMG 25793 / CGMCC 1.9160 / SL003B-26A1) TaxID=991905 RepID=F2J2K3_POLGS|nr:C4-dicarboxylate TRAP transporter substrate-binding protein [Polymorphum gilvum]ADZ70917.1 TRAP dicarboxylate transporter, DctP subunit [Polymorphum gilvum SL003B-26A1]